jgi:DNA-binding transcriptional LysR family regulator
VALRLAEHEPDDALAALARREVDIAVAHSYSLLPRNLPTSAEQRRLLDDPVLLALPTELAAARGLVPNEVVALADFAREPWLVPGRVESCHEMVQRACGAAGFVPDGVAEATDFAVLTALVAAGAGVALVPRMALPDGPPTVSIHPLREPVTRKVFALTGRGAARRPDIGRALAALAGAAAMLSGHNS